jgi:phosphoglycerate-specific signal transduction histidine kinase
MTDSIPVLLKRVLDGQARLEQRLRDVYRATLNVEDAMAQTAQQLAEEIGKATTSIRDTRQSMNTAFHTLLDKIGQLAAQGDTAAIEQAVSGLRGEVDTLTSDVLANTPANEPAPPVDPEVQTVG